jgi:hypothetical protein
MAATSAGEPRSRPRRAASASSKRPARACPHKGSLPAWRPTALGFGTPVTLALLLAACGTRTPIPEEAIPVDAAADVDAAPLPPVILPPNNVCFEPSATPNVTCRLTRQTRGRTCEAELDCEGQTFNASCGADGICRCENVGFNTCYCRTDPRLEDACGPARCCFR